MKKLFYILLAAVGLLAVGCTVEEAPKEETGLVFREVPVNIGQDGEEDTKSLVSVDVEGFKKAALFAFNASTKKVITRNGAPISITTESKIFSWSLPVNVAMDVYVLVNYGDMDISSYLTNASLTESQLEALKFTCNGSDELRKLETKGYGLPMASVKRGVTITSSNSTLAFKVKRLFSKYDFYFDPSEFTSAGYTVNALYISSSKANTEVPFFVEGFKQTDQSKLKIVDLGTPEDISNLNYGDKAHAISLYFLENCQGNKSGAANWWDVAKSGMDGLNLCTYIDVGVKTTDPNGNDCNYFYWIYLGDDCKSNFDVNRNQYRTIKMKLRKPTDVPPVDCIVFNDAKNKYSYNGPSVVLDRDFYLFHTESNRANLTCELYNSSGALVYTRTLRSNTVYAPTGFISSHVFIRFPDEGTYKIVVGKKESGSWLYSDSRKFTWVKGAPVYNKLERLSITNRNLTFGQTAYADVQYRMYQNDNLWDTAYYTDSNYYYDWTSSNSNVASVESNGTITAGTTSGTATITATRVSMIGWLSPSSVSNTVTVGSGGSTDVYTIELSPNPASVQVGKTVTLTPTVKKNGSTYSYTGSFTWTSSATGKATVSNGVVTGVAAGSSTITAKATIGGNTIQGTATVNVTAAATPDVYTIELSPNPASVQVGKTVTLTPTVKKNGSTYSYTGSFTWTSSATAKATVSNGVVTGVAAGSSTITAKATIGGNTIQGTATVNVTEKEPIGTEYQNVSVTLTATPNSFTASGGSSTLSASGTWQERTKYSDGTYSSWTNKSTTTFSDFTISGSATGFTRSGASVSVAANTGAARSVTYTAKLTKGSVSGQGQATITQAKPADVYTIELSPDNQNIYVGGSTLTLTATVKKNGSAVTVASGDIAWSSSATSKATVSGNGATGTVTPVAAQDGVKITANYKNGTAVGEATVNVKANDVIGTEYQDLTVTISASPTTIAAAGGNSTLTASVSYKTRDKYANGTYSSWTTVTSGVPKISGGANWITQLSNEAAKTKTVTAQKQANTGAQRKATYTASFTIGSLSKSASCEITQTKSEASSTEYQNVSVTLTATPSSIAASGGSSTLSASGTWQERIKYTNGDYGSWTSKSTTNFSDFTVTGSATGFTRNGASVTVAANTGAARSVTYTAKLTKGSVSGQGQATITQAKPVVEDNFEWIDTNITLDAGGTATAQFYSSKRLSSADQYDGGKTNGVEVVYNLPSSTGSTGARAYKGTATITAKSTAGGTTQTVTGQTGNSNDQLNVTVQKVEYRLVVTKTSSADRFSHHDVIRYAAFLNKYVNDVLVPSAKEDVTSGSTWSRGNNSSYVTVVDKGVVRSANYSLTNTTRHAEQSGYVVASYTRDGVTYTAQERVAFEETYNVFVQYVRQNASSYSPATRLKVRPELNTSLPWATASYVSNPQNDVLLEYRINANAAAGEWQGGFTETERSRITEMIHYTDGYSSSGSRYDGNYKAFYYLRGVGAPRDDH